MERLDKILANTGRRSRKEARELVWVGRVAMDGVTAQVVDGKYGPAARFEVDGETVSGEQLVHLMPHKPAGLVFATEDPCQSTVLELLPQHLRRVGLFPAGRLDRDTEGLLLLTSDGPLAHRPLVPQHHVDKIYFARADGELDGADVAAFVAEVMLENGLACLPVGLEVLEQPDTAPVTLYEGKYHQVKRMLVAWGKPVAYLRRLTMRSFMLDPALERGEWWSLSAEGVAALRQAQRRPGRGTFTANSPDTAGHVSALAQRYGLVYALPSSPSPRPLCFLSALGNLDKKFCKTY